ncbi:hypothetical protein [Aureimonas glaciei]|uniref:Uncharacterized protein n=1 Tax=Aureimonas glaciei TaxID=1776957 RepID=A0A916Y4T5_9HYPH|nr:hypothetical protein [Aureimonas glaciei]GGD31252.1 hypothetical protein GCM10011335_37800 [Aureimonas glaciei]
MKYSKPTSAIDAATGDLVIRVPAATIAVLTERWYVENSGEHDHIRIIDLAGLAEAVCKNVHGYDEDFFPGDMSAVESWIDGSGCQAVLEDDALFDVVPSALVDFPRQVFFGDWRGQKRFDLVDDFNIHRSELIGVEFLFADCSAAQDEGRIAYVIFRRGGELYEVSACHGADRDDFDGKWIPVKTTVQQLRERFALPEKGFQIERESIRDCLEEIEAGQRKASYEHMLESVKAVEDAERDAYRAR